MHYKNPHHLSLRAARLLFNSYLERYPNIAEQAESAIAHQLEQGLGLATAASFKLVHPLLIEAWKTPRMKFRTKPLEVIGLDIETVALCKCESHSPNTSPDVCNAGSAKLFGCWYPEPVNKYVARLNPKLIDLFNLVRNACENTNISGFVTWGRLDIQCLIKLFQPNEKERTRISRGLSANIKRGEIIGSPPVMRQIGKAQFYISHYIAGRSLKLGYLEAGRERTFWIFNLSQFYQNTIAITAKGLGLKWRDFDKKTHIIDWGLFARSETYRTQCLASNEQDAVTVYELAMNLQTRFHDVFDCYPSLLVSTGSLTDAAVSKMLSDTPDDYASNSWKWLAKNVWSDTDESVIARAETLLAEAFSAGYVDQGAIGYFPELHTADIAAAYPHKIRQLPDLRQSVLLDGGGTLEDDLQRARMLGYEILTVIIRGKVTIPQTLKFHPITVKTYDRENYRPTGTFFASYLLEERKFCESYGATFTDEQYIIVALTDRTPAPIAKVSEKLGEMRATLTTERDRHSKNSDKYRVFDGQQYLVKVIDNSIYGKTVQSVEVVTDVDGEPIITGYIAGDRFNPLYGAIITANTRIQVASACMNIVANGGRPVMQMTDSIYWDGPISALPSTLIRETKTPGYFDSPHSVSDFFMLKTGQYEFRIGEKWYYKLRGLSVNWDELNGRQSLYRRLIQLETTTTPQHTHPKDFVVTINTRRLISIGSSDLQHLGMIAEGHTDLRPFVFSGKQTERYIHHWRECIDGHQWLDTLHVTIKGNAGTSQYPLAFLSTIYEEHTENWSADRMKTIEVLKAKHTRLMDDRKRLFIFLAVQQTKLPMPDGRSFRLPWGKLESYFGISRTELPGYEKISGEQLVNG